MIHVLAQPSSEQSLYQSHSMSGVGEERAYGIRQLAYLINSTVKVNGSLV